MKADCMYKGILLFLALLVFVQGCSSDRTRRARRVSEARREIRAGASLLEKGRREEAVKAFDRALALARSDVDLHAAVAQLLVSEGMCEEGIAYVRRAIELPPAGSGRAALMMDSLRDSELYVLVGDVYSRINRVAEAEGAYRQAVALNEGNAAAYNNWGYMYAERGIRLGEALKLAKRAVELDPRNGCFVDSEGWACFKMGEMRRAVELLKRAAELSPSDAEIRRHLAKAYEAEGDRGAAWVEYEKARKLAASDDSIGPGFL